MKFTAPQLLQYAILEQAAIYAGKQLEPNLTPDQVDELWDDMGDDMGAIDEIRTSGVETGLDAQYSRHYESEAVAIQAPNEQWVGFTYWYGGGKHGEPESVEWIDYAYHLHCKEYEKLVTIQEFTKV